VFGVEFGGAVTGAVGGDAAVTRDVSSRSPPWSSMVAGVDGTVPRVGGAVESGTDVVELSV
jgi:hypothetical protein